MRNDRMAPRPCPQGTAETLILKAVRSRAPRRPSTGASDQGLEVLLDDPGDPCRRLLAATLPDLVPRLRRFKELSIDAATAEQLLKIAPATINRQLKAGRAKLEPRGRSHTKSPEHC